MRLSLRVPFVALTVVLLDTPAHADGPEAVVWYRASESCPAGAAFLEKVPKRGTGARLAEAGDHIDFLVTLLAGPGETVGRLERQTRSATVAIRELRDANCEQVADALALSLSLALDPGEGPHAAEPAPVDVPASAPSATEGTAPVDPAKPPAAAFAPPPSPAKDTVAAVLPAHPARDSSPDAIVDGGILTGVLPEVAARASILAEVKTPNGALPDLAFRFGVSGALGRGSTVVGDVSRYIVAGRSEACPVSWESAELALSPCAAFELGVTGASDSRPTARRDTAVWVAPGAALHGSARVFGPASLELTGGALVPLVRSELAAGTATIYRSDIIAFHASVGVSLRFR